MKIRYDDLNKLDQDERVSVAAIQLFRHLARVRGGSTEPFKMTHAYMGALMNRSVASIKRYLKELEAAGWIVKRGNAAVFNGIKKKIANSYRLVKAGTSLRFRKKPAVMDYRGIARKGIANVALWLMNARSESVQEYIQPLSPSFCRQSALEAMLKDRERRRRER